jgi:hypothetical protein
LDRLKGNGLKSPNQEGSRMKSARLRAGLWLLGLTALLAPAGVLLAQDEEPSAAAGAAAMAGMGVLIIVFLVFFAAIYVYFALAFSTIAKKTNTPNAWWAWVPILNIVLLVNIAKKPVWWVILFFVPIVSIVAAIIVMMGVAEARNKPNWWGILMIVPVVNFIVPGYLAWVD